MQLRPYQIEAIREIYRLIVSGGRSIILQAPTGSGKTAMASQIISDAAVKRKRNVLVLAHRGELVDQLSGSLATWGVAHGIIRAGQASESARAVQVASIQSLDSGVALPHLGDHDLIVVDECHRRDAEKVFTRYPQVRRLGLTATPYQMDGLKVVPLKHYETIVVAAEPEELLAKGYIVPLVILAPPMPERLSGVLFNDDETLTARERVMGEAHVMGDVVATWIKHGPRATIGYCCGIAHSKKQAEAFMAAGVSARAISGEEPLEERREILADFRAGKFKVLLNSDLLIEGLDVPFVSRILKLRPTQSPAVDLQQTGRGVRTAPGKVNCEIFDHAGNFFLHGHPYWERLTSVDPMPGIGRCDVGDIQGSTWRCPDCYCVVGGPPGADCPYCGTKVKTKARRLKVVAGKLIEYDEDQLKRAKEEKDNQAAIKAVNHSRIRSLYGVAYRAGLTGKARDAFVFSEFAKFKKAVVPWEHFLEEAAKRTHRPSISSSNPFKPPMDGTSSC